MTPEVEMADDVEGPEAHAAADHRTELHLADDRVAGFDELFARESQPMVRLAYLLVGSVALAEEIVQDAFATVYVRWSRIDAPGGFLRQCVVNGAKSSLRRRKLELRRNAEVVDEGNDLQARELLDALATLPYQWRAVVVLRFYNGLSQQEIADALDLRLGTVKSSLHRGLAKLREVIEP